MKINKKFWLFVLMLLVIVLAIASFMAAGGFKKDDNNSKSLVSLSDYVDKDTEKTEKSLITVSGTVVCLPIKDSNLPHNDLCVLGLKDTGDDYYRLQSISDDKNNVANKIKIGQKIEIVGEFFNENDDVYKIKGTIGVDSIKYLETNENEAVAGLPESFKANYISFQNYDMGIFDAAIYPRLESWVENGEIECTETPAESSLPIRISKQEINGKKYCIAASSEGAAGSVYTQYSYSTVIGDKVYLVNFLARYPQCMNYPEEKSIECIKERESFDLNVLVDLEIEKAQILTNTNVL